MLAFCTQVYLGTMRIAGLLSAEAPNEAMPRRAEQFLDRAASSDRSEECGRLDQVEGSDSKFECRSKLSQSVRPSEVSFGRCV